MMNLELGQQVVRMALRNVTRNRRRSLLAGTMVAAGVAAILFAKAYLSGLQQLIKEGVIDAGQGALQVMHEGYATAQEMSPLHLDLPEDPALVARIARVENVKAVAPRMRFMGIISAGDTGTAFHALAIDPEREREVCPRGPAARTDRLEGPGLSSSDAPEVLLGIELARALKVKIGDTITLLTQTRSGSMDAMDATVTGTYRFDDLELNKRLVVMPLASAQKLLHMKDRVTSYSIAVYSLEKLDQTVASVSAALSSGPWQTETRDWGTLNPRFRDLLLVEDAVLGVLLFIVFGLVLTGVVNTMLMSVFERTREIGTLMSMGFSRERVAALFLCEAALLGAFASAIGAAIGTTLTWYTHQVGIPFRVPGVGLVENRPVLALSFAIAAVFGAVLGALMGGLWPAYRAARLEPVEALSSH